MHVGVYGSGYLGTVISAALPDFGTPVSCCDTDSTRMVEMAQGNICFFEKNLKEIVKRNVRCGRLSYSTHVEAFSKKAQVVFLAEDSADTWKNLFSGLPAIPPKPSPFRWSLRFQSARPRDWNAR